MSLIPKNWAAFQHYKDRAPAWIKLHRGILDDYDFACLPVASRALAPLLWLLASEYEQGEITASIDEIAFRLRMPGDELRAAIKPLVDKGVFNDASNTLAGCKQEAILEREKEGEIQEEKEGEKRRGALKRASRIPENWMPTDQGGQFALSHGLSEAEANTELEKFTNYWTAKSGQGATKLDWDATWRNWILTAAERKGKPNGQHGKPSLSEVAFDLADRARRREHEAGAVRPPVAVRGS